MPKWTLSLLTLTLGLAAATASQAAPASKYRQVDAQGVGNCLFSAQPLPFQQEAGYQPKTSFNAPEGVHARCYFPKPLSDYRSMGAVYNSLRDKNEYYAAFHLIPNDISSFKIDGRIFAPGPLSQGEQQAFEIDGSAHSDFGFYNDGDADKNGATVYIKDAERYAFDIGRFTKLESLHAGKYPYTSKYCLDVYVLVADQISEESKYDDFSKKTIVTRKPVLRTQYIARSCMDYTLKQAADVNWEPTKSVADYRPDKVMQDQARNLIKGLGF